MQWTLLLPIFDVTQGEAGCRTVVSEPFSLSGGDLALKTLSTFDAPRGDCALASNPGQCITHAAETCIGNTQQEAFVGSLAIQTVEGADYCATHYTAGNTCESHGASASQGYDVAVAQTPAQHMRG